MLEYLQKANLLFWLTAGLFFVALIGLGDILSGREIAFSLFYLLPIVLVTWFSGRNPGLVMSVAGAVMWYFADILAGQTYSRPIIGYWNAAIRLGFFAIVTLLLPALKALEQERNLARTDDLTGAANRRSFFELGHRELDRSLRNKKHPSIAYIDIDNFKSVNDVFGHKTGDKVLCAVVKQARRLLRKTDLMARLGGDEFVILLPETSQGAAKIVIGKIQDSLMKEMRLNNWPVTFSIGVLTARVNPITIDEFLKRADSLMYEVKKNGKNAIAYAVYAG